MQTQPTVSFEHGKTRLQARGAVLGLNLLTGLFTLAVLFLLTLTEFMPIWLRSGIFVVTLIPYLVYSGWAIKRVADSEFPIVRRDTIPEGLSRQD